MANGNIQTTMCLCSWDSKHQGHVLCHWCVYSRRGGRLVLKPTAQSSAFLGRRISRVCGLTVPSPKVPFIWSPLAAHNGREHGVRSAWYGEPVTLFGMYFEDFEKGGGNRAFGKFISAHVFEFEGRLCWDKVQISPLNSEDFPI